MDARSAVLCSTVLVVKMFGGGLYYLYLFTNYSQEKFQLNPPKYDSKVARNVSINYFLCLWIVMTYTKCYKKLPIINQWELHSNRSVSEINVHKRTDKTTNIYKNSKNYIFGIGNVRTRRYKLLWGSVIYETKSFDFEVTDISGITEITLI